MLICNICKYINIDTAKMLLCTQVQSRLDYVNPYYQGHQQLQQNHIKQHKTLQPGWPTRSQEERMSTHVYRNCIGCPSSIEPYSGY